MDKKQLNKKTLKMIKKQVPTPRVKWVESYEAEKKRWIKEWRERNIKDDKGIL